MGAVAADGAALGRGTGCAAACAGAAFTGTRGAGLEGAPVDTAMAACNRRPCAMTFTRPRGPGITDGAGAAQGRLTAQAGLQEQRLVHRMRRQPPLCTRWRYGRINDLGRCRQGTLRLGRLNGCT